MKCYVQFLSKFVSTCCFDLLKKEYISNFKEISHKKEENYFWNLIFSFIWWATSLTNSLYGPHGTYLSGSAFILHQKGRKKLTSIFPLSSRGWNTLPGACSDLDLGHHICTIGSKVTAILLIGWILPNGWVASRRVCICSLCSRLVLNTSFSNQRLIYW